MREIQNHCPRTHVLPVSQKFRGGVGPLTLAPEGRRDLCSAVEPTQAEFKDRSDEFLFAVKGDGFQTIGNSLAARSCFRLFLFYRCQQSLSPSGELDTLACGPKSQALLSQPCRWPFLNSAFMLRRRVVGSDPTENGRQTPGLILRRAACSQAPDMAGFGPRQCQTGAPNWIITDDFVQKSKRKHVCS